MVSTTKNWKYHFSENLIKKLQISHTSTGIFLSIFYHHYSVGKTKSSSKFRNSILYFLSFQLLIFHCNCWVLFLIHYPLEKHFQEGYIFSVCYSRCGFSSNLAGFEKQNFHSLSWVTMEVLWVSLANIKSQSSKTLLKL